MKRKHSLSLLLFIAAFFTVFFANGQSNQLNITDFPHDRSTQLEQFYRNDDEHDNTKNSRHFKGLNNQLDNPNKTVKNNFLKSGNNKQVPVEYYDIYWDSAFIIDFYPNEYKKRRLISRDVSGNLLSEIYHYYDSSSNIWIHIENHAYTYDESNNMLSELYEYVHSDTVIFSWKNNFTYDASGNMLSKISHSWNDQTNNLKLASNLSYTYDLSGNLLSEVYQYYDSYFNIWININEVTYFYDESKNLISYIEKGWSEESSAWVNSSEYFYEYDSSGNRVSYLSQNWDYENNIWLNFNFVTSIYDVYGNKISEIHQHWDKGNSNWKNNGKRTYIYDASGNVLSEIDQGWNKVNNNWENSSMFNYTYDVSGNILSQTSQQWESLINDWGSPSKTTYNYDEYGNMLLELNQYQISGSNEWINYSKFEWQHDFEAKKSSGSYFEWSDYENEWWPASTRSLSIYLFGNRVYYYSTSWGGIHSAEIYYSVYSDDKEDGVSDDDNSLIIYPNPAGKTVNIKFTTSSPESGNISICDAFGKLVKEIPTGNIIPGEYVFPVDVSSLEAGIYLVKLSTSGFYQTQKLVIVK